MSNFTTANTALRVRDEPFVIVIDGLHLKNTLNAWEPWYVRSKREKAEASRVGYELMSHRDLAFALPLVVTMTRIYSGRMKEMDTDGLAAAFKKARDEVAKWLGVDDSPRSGVTWEYEQERGPTPGVRVVVGPDSTFRAAMVVCPICGNKRCPRAEDSRMKCTGSNEVGQVPREVPGLAEELKGVQ